MTPAARELVISSEATYGSGAIIRCKTQTSQQSLDLELWGLSHFPYNGLKNYRGGCANEY